MNRFAVVLTHNRPVLLAQCVAAIGAQVDMVIVVDNASDPPVKGDQIRVWVDPASWLDSWCTVVMQVPDQPPNLSKLWNLGIRAALNTYDAGPQNGHRAHIAVLCDDAVAPPGWFAAVTQAMDQTGAAVGASSPWGRPPGELIVKREPDHDLMGRMPGYAWILDPTSPVRPDETFAWWWGDTDVDWQARAAGGMVMIGGHAVVNAQPDYWVMQKPELAAQVALDSQAFVDKHGGRPW